MKYVSSATMLILVNGNPKKPFKLEIGLRQGDPLSPYIYILMNEVLGYLIRVVIRKNIVGWVLVGKEEVEITHLQFVNDTLFFMPKKGEILANYKRILDCYSIMPSLINNYNKTEYII